MAAANQDRLARVEDLHVVIGLPCQRRERREDFCFRVCLAGAVSPGEIGIEPLGNHALVRIDNSRGEGMIGELHILLCFGGEFEAGGDPSAFKYAFTARVSPR